MRQAGWTRRGGAAARALRRRVWVDEQTTWLAYLQVEGHGRRTRGALQNTGGWKLLGPRLNTMHHAGLAWEGAPGVGFGA